MKILVTSHSGIGGIARTAKQMHREILANHKNDELVVIYENRESNKEYQKRYCNTHVYSIPTPKGIHSFRSLTRFKDHFNPIINKMKAIIEKEKPDIILIIGTFYFPWFLLNATKEAKRPFIIRYGGIIEMEETKKIWLRMGKDFVNKDYYYIFPSYHSKGTVEGIHNIKLPHSWVIHNGLPEEFFKQRTRRKRPINDRFKIGFVGRHYRVKNPEFCITLADKLRSKNHSEIEMICGHNAKDSKDKKRISKDMKKFLKAGIKLSSTLSTDKLAKFYQSKDLIISPSHFETYGYVPLESIATGTPALINSTLGIKEVFTKLGLDDFIVDFTDLDHIMEKIEDIRQKKIIIDDDTSKVLRKEYSFSNTMLQFLDTFREILGNNS